MLKDQNTRFSETFRITTEARRICRYWINKNWVLLTPEKQVACANRTCSPSWWRKEEVCCTEFKEQSSARLFYTYRDRVFICAGTDSAEDVLKYSPQMDNEGKALGQAVMNGVWRNKCFHRNYHPSSYRSLLDVSQSKGSVGLTNLRNLAANSWV